MGASALEEQADFTDFSSFHHECPSPPCPLKGLDIIRAHVSEERQRIGCGKVLVEI